MNKFESVLHHAIEKSGANNANRRKYIYNKARKALNELFIDKPSPTNERIEQLILLEAAITNTESKLKWMQVRMAS